MTDLIRREDAINAIEQYCRDCNNYNGVRCRACNFDDAMNAVDVTPEVDAVEVVRCAECEHASEQQKHTNGAIRLLKVSPQCPMYDYYDHLVTASGYCQAGIRRKSTDGGEKND